MFLLKKNSLEPAPDEPIHFHLGCGQRIIDGFLNLDLLPEDGRVRFFDLLNPWPDDLDGRVSSIFSEDLIEHFFYNEQIYILCCANAALKFGGVFRILTPDLDQLIDCFRNASGEKVKDEYLGRLFGVETGADAINLGMRFGCHRWLHNYESLKRMGQACGFKVKPTGLSDSTLDKHNHFNLRTETDSISFAVDLVKERPVSKKVVFPKQVEGAEWMESVDGISMYRSTGVDPKIYYETTEPILTDQIGLLNIHSSVLTEFFEHNHAKLYVLEAEEYALHLDSSLRSRFYLNLFSGFDMALKIDGRKIRGLRFDPCESADAFFTAGPMEIFSF